MVFLAAPILPFPQVLDYDYYGAYGRERHRDYTYNRLLGDEYTFDFPPHHDIVSAGRKPPIAKTTGCIWSRGLEAAEPLPQHCLRWSW